MESERDTKEEKKSTLLVPFETDAVYNPNLNGGLTGLAYDRVPAQLQWPSFFLALWEKCHRKKKKEKGGNPPPSDPPQTGESLCEALDLSNQTGLSVFTSNREPLGLLPH